MVFGERLAWRRLRVTVTDLGRGDPQLSNNLVLKSYVTFDSDISRESGGGVPPGREIAELVSRQLAARGFQNSDVREHDSYGWYWEATKRGVKTWIMVQRSDQWLLITRPLMGFLGTLLRASPHDEHREVSDALAEILESDGRFQNVRWYSREEFENQARSP